MGDVDSRGKKAGRLLGGRYRLSDVLGRGGMGTVWRAEDEILGRTVAVKELRFSSSVDEEEKRRLIKRTLREAKAIARIRSSSAITVYDVVDEDDRPWIVMELVEGRSLADVLREDGPLTPRRAAEVGLAILDVLRAAHREGILHRDVKPSNVLIAEEDGRVVLTDFGIAQIEGDPSLTSTGMLVGAPSYIAPERARGQRPGPPSDLWSLGGLLYAAVEGHPPYDKGSAIATLTAVMTEPLEPPARAGELTEVIRGLLRKEPERRLDEPGARALLERALGGPAPAAPAEDGGTRTTVMPLAGADGAAGKRPAGAEKAAGSVEDAAGAGDAGGTGRADGAAADTAPGGARRAGASGGTNGERLREALKAVRDTVAAAAAGAAASRRGNGAAAAPAPGAADPPADASAPAASGSDASGSDAPATAGTASAAPAADGAAGAGGGRNGGSGGAATSVLRTRTSALARKARQPAGLAVVAAVVALAVLGTVLALVLGGGDGGDGGQAGEDSSAVSSGGGEQDSGGERDSGGGDGGASPEASPSGEDDGTAGQDGQDGRGDQGGADGAGGNGDDGGRDDQGGKAPPEGYETVTDDRFNFSMAMPEGYRRTGIAGQNSGGIYTPSGGGLPKIQVDFSGSPGEDAAAAWKALEPAVRGSSSGYTRLGIKSVDWRDYPTVADWTFERTEGGQRVRVLNRGFRVDGDSGYAVMITCPADEWDGAECRTVRKTAFGTFRPLS
ncbi:serine/threonine-protein kinase [Streptomyces sp. TRM 70361]|uniref:serine/threonine-protein kinase n=1 Tax=Streptomyces sp. TRM 70361 TaxID=3116553 RepID=UPI002E7B26A8|nr:serine/threonine-protein kinase [Streptomyces sp. TRM 70361]MEE1940596.1 serine/threonine-protein kinase [Streptomyces sp. TRM 70361]